MSMGQFAGSGEFVTATLRGYRCWRICPHMLTGPSGRVQVETCNLQAVSSSKVWPTNILEAECSKVLAGMIDISRHANGAPVDGCSCGIYGWYEPETAMQEHSACVMGAIECTGRVLLGTTGFRAQTAKIVAIAPGEEAYINSYIGGFQKATAPFILDKLDRLIYLENKRTGKTGINWDAVQQVMDASAENVTLAFDGHLLSIAENYGVDVFRSMGDLKAKYPPQLDTLENVLEGKLKRYGNSS